LTRHSEKKLGSSSEAYGFRVGFGAGLFIKKYIAGEPADFFDYFWSSPPVS
jgi:hypothetical protein